MATGNDLVKLAASRIGEKYLNVLVPKNNPNWHGPWDCAEFGSWVVYQKVRKLYGCVDNDGDPAITEAYTGAWARDCDDGALNLISQADANLTPGAILVRKPPAPGSMGHLAISDGAGGTIEAAGTGLGVRKGKIEGRLWHFCATIPELSSARNPGLIAPKPLPFLLQLTTPWTTGKVVKEVQRALRKAGVDPGGLDAGFGPQTVAAVYAFQKTHRLVADGIVGPLTASKLGIAWP